ncbi:MAG TPA: TIGR02452 family protein, partial [Abditibacteriaceae bacterium]|nr:TIGR02452 family protein [Abditibacteriaceae bacterium]
VTGETTLQAAQRLASSNKGNARTLCLDFASAKNPGGGFLAGSQAQEESLARSSALYICQLSQPAMYDFHRRLGTCLYSDHMILSPDVPVFRDDDGALLETPFLSSFVTSPAVNAGAVRRNEPQNVALIEPTMRQRLRKVLLLARAFEYSNLVLGAWGCGVFQNEADYIARLFFDALGRGGEFGKSFECVVLAVYDTTPEQKVLTSFQRKFQDQVVD